MDRTYDVLVVGSGPAGMEAAMLASRYGLDVVVVDEQPAPGGQIWRAVEANKKQDEILGPSYFEGRPVAQSFRASGVEYLPDMKVWQIESGFRALVSRDGKACALHARTVVLGAGAQERPVPFPGWTLPGVMTVGAAQILLKSAGQIPEGPLWIAGCGPLVLLYAMQLLQAGGEIAGILDTSQPGKWRRAFPHLPRALLAWRDIAKGLAWTARIRGSHVPVIKHVSALEAIGDRQIGQVRYLTAGGLEGVVDARALLVHEGVVPSIHLPLSMGCGVQWVEAQDCFVPVVDEWGESSQSNVFIVGDGAGIAGAKAARLRGRVAAHGLAVKLGRATEAEARSGSRKDRRRLSGEMGIRPFLDALYRPRDNVFLPTDKTVVCRCEEVTAGQIRDLANVGRPGPSQVKTASRAGMGPCQGRQCGYTVTRLLADAQGRLPADVGYFNVRPPLKPVTLGELAALELEPAS